MHTVKEEMLTIFLHSLAPLLPINFCLELEKQGKLDTERYRVNREKLLAVSSSHGGCRKCLENGLSHSAYEENSEKLHADQQEKDQTF